MTIKYPNGFHYAQHEDGTRFLTYPQKEVTIVEHDGNHWLEGCLII